MHSETGINMAEASGLVNTEASVVNSCCSAIWQEHLVFANQLAQVLRFTWRNSVHSTLVHSSPTIASNLKNTPGFLTMPLLGWNTVEGSLDVPDIVPQVPEAAL